ncbi:hypothetical protein GCM10011614_32420 [Novosphingobium colocasiae]|uniref:Uncharacterized protein n=1 Tax=Novosphingobium colocasiae TaxID=1256513 RepID=A0A918UJL6_9SPHN|nr:hypothetical protein GCM10011614_32420 [Novosphingobium colocasiae]
MRQFLMRLYPCGTLALGAVAKFEQIELSGWNGVPRRTAGNPIVMLEEPLFATKRALKRAGMRIENIYLYDVGETLAPVPLAWSKRSTTILTV